MFKDLKNREILAEILQKLAVIDTKITSLDKTIKDRQKQAKTSENQQK